MRFALMLAAGSMLTIAACLVYGILRALDVHFAPPGLVTWRGKPVGRD